MTPSPSSKHWLFPLIALTLTIPRTISTAQAEVGRNDSAAWVLFVDDLHVDFDNTGWLRTFIQTAATDVIAVTDTVAIRTSNPSKALGGMVDRTGLTPLVKELYGAGLRPNDLLSDRFAKEIDERARLSLSNARAAVELLANTDRQTRALIYISNGPWQHLNDQTQQFAEAVRRNGVKVFVINARGLGRSRRPAKSSDPVWLARLIEARANLSMIADATGGVAILDDGDTPAALDAIRRGMGR